MSQAVRGGIWTAGSRILAQGSQFAIFLVAVRVLEPAEFGIFALVAAWTVILSQFSMAGWPEYVMQWSGDSERPRQVLTVSLVCGLLLAGIGLLASLVMPGLDQTTITLLQVLVLCIPVGSLGATYAGILNWQDRLVAAAIATGLADLVGLAVAVIALLNDQGVLALAYGRLAGVLVWTATVAALARMGPVFPVPPANVLEMSRFAGRIIFVRLLINFRLYAGTLLIGAYLGAAEAGYFRAAQRLVTALGDVIGEPTRVLSWSLFRAARQAQDGGTDFRATANQIFPVILIFTVPLSVVMAVLAEDLVLVIFGDGWQPAAPVVRVLAIVNIVLAVGFAFEAVLSLAGRVNLMPWLASLFAALGIVLTMLAAPYGMLAAAYSQVLSAVIIFIISALVQQRIAGIRWGEIAGRLRALPFGVLGLLLVAWALETSAVLDAVPVIVRLVISTILMLAVFTCVVLLIDRRLLDRTRTLLRKNRGS